MEPLKRCLILRDAVARLDSTWQRLLAHELRRRRVRLVCMYAAQVRHVRSVYVALALHVGQICRRRQVEGGVPLLVDRNCVVLVRILVTTARISLT